MSTGISFLTEPRRFASARVAYYYNGSDISIPGGDPWRWDTLSDAVKPVGNWVLSPTTYAFQCPADGYYALDASALTTSGGTVAHDSSSAAHVWEISDDNVTFSTAKSKAASPSGLRNPSSSASFEIKAGQWVRIRNGACSFTQEANTGRFITIHRITDTSHGQPVGYALADADRAGLLERYEEVVITGTTTGAITETFTLKLSKSNSRVTASAQTPAGSAASENNITIPAGSVPERFRPTEDGDALVWVRSGGTTELGRARIRTDGSIGFLKHPVSNFNASSAIGLSVGGSPTFFSWHVK